jgi:hypothetical protein
VLIGDGSDLSPGSVDGVAPEAEVTYLGGEPTVHAFQDDKVEQAMRFTYRADASRIDFALVVSGDTLNTPETILKVARQVAYALNADSAIPGVLDMEETQYVTPLGSINDIWNVAFSSTSGLTTQIVQLQQLDMRADLFATTAAYWRAQLDKYEGV